MVGGRATSHQLLVTNHQLPITTKKVAQMYKISINETPLILRDLKGLSSNPKSDEKNLVLEYTGKTKMLLQEVDMLEKSQHRDSVTIYAKEYVELVNDFNQLYKKIEAAGGVVFNPKGEILTMYRRGSWDLPKGKIDKGETKEVAAIREVQEETGLQQVERGPLLHTTYHTYKNRKGKRVLKPTYWYRMTTLEYDIHPQTEEDIELVEWIDPVLFLETKRPIYNTIWEVVVAAIELTEG